MIEVKWNNVDVNFTKAYLHDFLQYHWQWNMASHTVQHVPGEVFKCWNFGKELQAIKGVFVTVAQHNTTQQSTKQHSTKKNTKQHGTKQQNTSQNNTKQNKTKRHNTTQHSTAQNNTTQCKWLPRKWSLVMSDKFRCGAMTTSNKGNHKFYNLIHQINTKESKSISISSETAFTPRVHIHPFFENFFDTFE